MLNKYGFWFLYLPKRTVIIDISIVQIVFLRGHLGIGYMLVFVRVVINIGLFPLLDLLLQIIHSIVIIQQSLHSKVLQTCNLHSILLQAMGSFWSFRVIYTLVCVLANADLISALELRGSHLCRIWILIKLIMIIIIILVAFLYQHGLMFFIHFLIVVRIHIHLFLVLTCLRVLVYLIFIIFYAVFSCLFENPFVHCMIQTVL